MPTQDDMTPKDYLYRATLEEQQQPKKLVPNPHFDPTYRAVGGSAARDLKPWAQSIYIDDGPVVWKESMIGPYKDIRHIKSHVTRNRPRSLNQSLRVKRIERVSAWEEVDFK